MYTIAHPACGAKDAPLLLTRCVWLTGTVVELEPDANPYFGNMTEDDVESEEPNFGETEYLCGNCEGPLTSEYVLEHAKNDQEDDDDR
jgi:hypothetical protein